NLFITVEAYQLQQSRPLWSVQRLYVTKLARDRTRATTRFVDRPFRSVELLAELFPDVTIFHELGFSGSQHLPDLARALLDRQGPEPHLEAAEQGRERRRPLNHDPMLSLQLARETRAADHLGKQPFGR